MSRKKASKRTGPRDEPAPREFRTHARFTPTGPEPADSRAFLDFWIAASQYALEQKSATNQPRHPASAEDVADLELELRVLEAARHIHKGFSALIEPALRGNRNATKALLDNAISAVQWLQFAERAQPELFREHASLNIRWPILAKDEADWARVEVERIDRLQLGAKLGFFRTKFRRARGADENHPARLWAKAAVRVIEETRWRIGATANLIEKMGSSEAFADFTIETGWCFAPTAHWAHEVGAIGELSAASLPAWKRVIRQMIREELPDFHTAAEWSNQRNTAVKNQRHSKGEIQCAILDDICSALTRLAPEKPC